MRSTASSIEFIICVPAPMLEKSIIGVPFALKFGLFEVYENDVGGRGTGSLSYVAENG